LAPFEYNQKPNQLIILAFFFFFCPDYSLCAFEPTRQLEAARDRFLTSVPFKADSFLGIASAGLSMSSL
jgi:hypothetical protein